MSFKFQLNGTKNVTALCLHLISPPLLGPFITSLFEFPDEVKNAALVAKTQSQNGARS